MASHPFFAMKVGGRVRAVAPYGRFDGLKAMTDWVSRRSGAELDISKINTGDPAGIASDGGLIYLCGSAA